MAVVPLQRTPLGPPAWFHDYHPSQHRLLPGGTSRRALGVRAAIVDRHARHYAKTGSDPQEPGEDYGFEPWPLDANEAATSGHGERGPGRLHMTWHVTLSVTPLFRS